MVIAENLDEADLPQAPFAHDAIASLNVGRRGAALRTTLDDAVCLRAP